MGAAFPLLVNFRWLALLLLTAACGEPEPTNQPLATDYLPSRTREAEKVITCEAIEGSPGWAVLVEKVTDIETEKVSYRYAEIPAEDVDEACRRCGGTYRLATTKEIASVRDDEGTSLSQDGFTFRGGKEANASSSSFWVSSAAFTDPYRSERAKSPGAASDEPSAEHAVMCKK